MKIPDAYFLTSSKKKKELRSLQRCLKKGYVDKKMIPYLEVINKLPGIVSEFCCQGHPDKPGKAPNYGRGNLILLLSEKAFRRITFGYFGGSLEEVIPNEIFDRCSTCHTELYNDIRDGGSNRNCRLIFEFDYEKRKECMEVFIDRLKRRLSDKRYDRI